jgi:two-component system chemotaxis response regulator CheY
MTMEEAALPSAPEAPAEVPRRILLADDNMSSRQLLTRLLRSLTTAELHEARDGTAALARFNLLQPRVTMLDIDMPELDGLAVLEQIRAIDKQAFVVMVSAYSKIELVRKALELGIGGFVVKPYSEARIAEVLRIYAKQKGDAEMLRKA